MRVLNFKARKFAVGKKVIVKMLYQSGQITLQVGAVGKIVGESYQTLPDLNLFNIRVIDLEFSTCKLSIGEGIAEVYMDEL